MREYLIYCRECHAYTLLGQYLEQEGSFEGEYSLVHNVHMQSDELLCRFLMEHRHHTLQVIPDKTDEYKAIVGSGSRFKEEDIDRYVQQSMQQKQKQEKELQAEQTVGQLELAIFKKMLEDEIDAVAAIKSNSKATGQFYLGKEEGLKEALQKLKDLTAETHSVYNSSS